MIQNFAMILQDSDVVENIIVADDDFIAPEGRYLVALPARPEIGWIYDRTTGTFIPADPIVATDVSLLPADIADLLAALAGGRIGSDRAVQIAKKITINGVDVSIVNIAQTKP